MNEILIDEQINLLTVFERHKSFCSDFKCFCRQQSVMVGGDGTFFLIQAANFDRYIRILIKIDMQLKVFFHNINVNILHFIYYMDYMTISGKHSYAIQKIIEFINENERMIKVTLEETNKMFHFIRE